MDALAPLLVALAQATAFVATFDIFPAVAVPRSVRAVLALLLVPLILTTQSFHVHARQALISAICGAVLVGVGFGLCASIIASAARAAGSIIDNALAGGLVGQSIFAGGGPMQRLYSTIFILIFLSSGAYTRLLASFIAAGSALPDHFHAAGAAVALARSSMQAGLNLAGPALLMQAVAALLSGALARVAPHINGMLLNAPLSSALTLLCLATGSAVFWPALVELSEKVVALSDMLNR